MTQCHQHGGSLVEHAVLEVHPSLRLLRVLALFTVILSVEAAGSDLVLALLERDERHRQPLGVPAAFGVRSEALRVDLGRPKVACIVFALFGADPEALYPAHHLHIRALWEGLLELHRLFRLSVHQVESGGHECAVFCALLGFQPLHLRIIYHLGLFVGSPGLDQRRYDVGSIRENLELEINGLLLEVVLCFVGKVAGFQTFGYLGTWSAHTNVCAGLRS